MAPQPLATPDPRASIPIAMASHPRSCGGCARLKEASVAKKGDEGVYRIVDVVGVSEVSWEEAGRQAIKTASKSLRDLRIAEVTKMDMKVEDGKVVAFRTRVALSFKYEG